MCHMLAVQWYSSGKVFVCIIAINVQHCVFLMQRKVDTTLKYPGSTDIPGQNRHALGPMSEMQKHQRSM